MKHLLLLLVFFLTQIAGIQAQNSQQKPNIILVMADQWRRQALGFTNEDAVLTPELDAYSKEAAFFKNAVANTPICTPSRATMFTGQYNITNGVFGNHVRLSTNSITLGDITKDQGYHTAYIGKYHLDGKSEGYVPRSRRHGFDYWILSSHHRPFDQNYYIQDARQPVTIPGWEPDYMTGKAIEYIDSVADIDQNPFCMVLSFGPPHTGGGPGFEDRYQPDKFIGNSNKHKMGYGYAAPKKYEALYPTPEKMKRRPNVAPVGKFGAESWPVLPGYFGAITSIDENFGKLIRFLKKKGIFENTIIVFTADHGEMLGSHGRMTKGIWNEESIGVPMMLSYPGKIKPDTYKNPMATIDILPTVLGLAGLPAPAHIEGFNYENVLTGKNGQAAPEYAYCSFDQGAPDSKDRSWRAIYNDQYTYIIAKPNEYKRDKVRKEGFLLYDKRKDPYEMQPIYKGMGYDAVIDDLHAKLVAHLTKLNDPFLTLQWKTDSSPKYTWFDAKDKKSSTPK
ncbi:sulfatase [Niabella insulamsoli]|uniref:sulfatase family protein n=1 Tax=Niabella insulamsoli TaxID=3144874 RepID=UPI0031FBB13A